VTSKTCVAGDSVSRIATAEAGREATVKLDGDLVFVRTGGVTDHKLLHFDGSASDVRIDRLAQLPAVCVHPTADSPLGNFDVFTSTWAENYISFDLKKTNWNEVAAANRAKVSSSTTPEQLFDILEAMIKPFGDAHTRISALVIKRHFIGIRPGTDRVQNRNIKDVLAVTEHAYLKEPLRDFCNNQIQYGHLDAHTGYLRILSFSRYAKPNEFAAGLAALEAALDTIFSDSALKALVIDVRINFGGDDPYGLAIASRLATSQYLAYTKEARADAFDHNRWTPPDRSIVTSSSRPGFKGPVVELTGPLTISAGETFTQALMGRTPHVTRIGENTQGVFSDVLGRRLPNGWTFGLPNEVYRTPQGTTFDGPGIPPDIAVPVFADDDVAAGQDPAIVRALEILNGKK
jgi:hypothetical protein